MFSSITLPGLNTTINNIVCNFFKYTPNTPINFTHTQFWIFFFIVFIIFCFVYKKHAARNLWLFVTSLFFYYKASGEFFLLIILSIITNYFFGKVIYKAKTTLHKKIWLTTAITYNLGWLCYYKYPYFIVGIINSLFDTNIITADIILDNFNKLTDSSFNASEIILPVGISFYTFQIISYLVDLYRQKVKPVKNIADFGFYVTFFPQLIAGPIVRAAAFVPQMYSKYNVSKLEIAQALFFILNGLIKKIVIADYISVNFVDRVFDNPAMYSGAENILAVYGYSLQIYCDFSGYTDIAIGLALILGFRLPINFNSPYKATSITNFWQRWHISLSTWLKDYLYIPLGGNKKGRHRTYLNLLITMLLGGLWHGASLMFIIWGALHGLYLIIDKLFKAHFKIKQTTWLNKLGMLFTFNIITFTWITFRCTNFDNAQIMILKIVQGFNIHDIFLAVNAYYKVFAIIAFGYIVHWLPANIKNFYKGHFVLTPIYLLAIITVLVIFVLYQFSNIGIQPFIYFRF